MKFIRFLKFLWDQHQNFCITIIFIVIMGILTPIIYYNFIPHGSADPGSPSMAWIASALMAMVVIIAGTMVIGCIGLVCDIGYHVVKEALLDFQKQEKTNVKVVKVKKEKPKKKLPQRGILNMRKPI